jgi:pilus assembly protein CpaE
MTLPRINAAILSPSMETRGVFRGLVNDTTLASVQLEVDQYCATFGDRPTRRLIEAQPQVILIDMNDPKAAVRALSILHLELPDTWLFVSAENSEKESIIESMRAGAREFLPQPIQPNTLTQAFARYITEHRPDQESGKGHIYCVTSAKDGVGATSVAINIAVALAGLPDTRVALIDLNSPVGDVAAYLNIRPQYTVADALAAASQLDPVLLETFMNHVHGVAVLSGLKEFQPMPALRPESLSQMLEMVSQSYTHILIDLPASVEQEHLQVLMEVSTALLVVLTPELPALWRTDRLLRFLASVGGTGGTERLRLVVNRVTPNDEIDEKAISKALANPVYWRLPNNYRAAINAINTGKPLVALTNSALVASYMKLARDLSGKNAKDGKKTKGENEKPRSFLGLFSSFGKKS